MSPMLNIPSSIIRPIIRLLYNPRPIASESSKRSGTPVASGKKALIGHPTKFNSQWLKTSNLTTKLAYMG